MGLEDSIIRIQATHAILPRSPPVQECETEKSHKCSVKDAALFKNRVSSDETSTYVPWIEGLKGLLAIESFFWLFFRTFLPACVYSGVIEDEPAWEAILRKVLSPLLWDGTLQWSFFLILSGRVVALRFREFRTESRAYSID